MQNINESISQFLGQKSIAVVGVSTKRETGCNSNYKKFKEHGYKVSAVSPHIAKFNDDPCYPDLKSIPQKPDAVFIMTNPKISEQIVRECIDLQIKYVWMHCMMGTKPGLMTKATSVSQSAAELARANGITVIPGTCPAQFLAPDGAHRLMRGMFRFFGFVR